jgi:hypothetical protein
MVATSQHLLRNSCQTTLFGSELEAKSGSLFLETPDEVVLIFFFVVAFARVAVGLPVFKHSINDPGQLVGHGFDRGGSVESCSQASAEGAQSAFTFKGRLRAESQDIGGAIMAAVRFAR